MREPSNLPPGVTENMIPGSGGPTGWELVPEDFTEVTHREWCEWQVGEGESECDLCQEVVGAYLAPAWQHPDVDEECWAVCWEVDEKVVCDDCKEWMLERAEQAQAAFEAAEAKYRQEDDR